MRGQKVRDPSNTPKEWKDVVPVFTPYRHLILSI
jgi:hypothetical protein